MLKSVVPTWRKTAVACSVDALMAKTSSSGKVKRTAADQSRPATSRQTPFSSALRTRPTRGAGALAWLVAGPRGEPGTVVPSTVHGVLLSKPAQARSADVLVVWFPDLKTAA